MQIHKRKNCFTTSGSGHEVFFAGYHAYRRYLSLYPQDLRVFMLYFRPNMNFIIRDYANDENLFYIINM